MAEVLVGKIDLVDQIYKVLKYCHKLCLVNILGWGKLIKIKFSLMGVAAKPFLSAKLVFLR